MRAFKEEEEQDDDEEIAFTSSCGWMVSKAIGCIRK